MSTRDRARPTVGCDSLHVARFAEAFQDRERYDSSSTIRTRVEARAVEPHEVAVEAQKARPTWRNRSGRLNTLAGRAQNGERSNSRASSRLHGRRRVHCAGQLQCRSRRPSPRRGLQCRQALTSVLTSARLRDGHLDLAAKIDAVVLDPTSGRRQRTMISRDREWRLQSPARSCPHLTTLSDEPDGHSRPWSTTRRAGEHIYPRNVPSRSTTAAPLAPVELTHSRPPLLPPDVTACAAHASGATGRTGSLSGVIDRTSMLASTISMVSASVIFETKRERRIAARCPSSHASH